MLGSRDLADYAAMQPFLDAENNARERRQVTNPMLPLPTTHFSTELLRSAANAPAIVAASTPSTAATFISNHTVHVTPMSPNDECAICLESYTEELCLRIIGITGCNHHIGAKCLRQLLCSSPHAEKRCPLCRAFWIPRARVFPSVLRSTNIHDLNEPSGAGTPSSIRAYGQRAGHLPAINDQRPRPLPRLEALHTNLNRPQVPQAPIVIDSDSESEEEYATQVRSFQEFTRDVADIRERAQLTDRAHVARQRRHRYRSVSGHRDIGGTSNEMSNRLGRSNTLGGGDIRNRNGAFNRILNTGRHFNLFRLPPDDAPSYTNPAEGFPAANSPTLPTLPDQVFDRLGMAPVLARTPENTFTAPPAPSSPVFHAMTSPLAIPSSPTYHGFSSGPAATHVPNRDNVMSNANNAVPQRPTLQASSLQHTDELTRREQALIQREEDLNYRGQALDALQTAQNVRHHHLDRREAAVLERERNTEALLLDLQRRRTELAELLGRQREEVNRVLGS
ncbi:zf-RING-2 multi-domain protein [Pyrenophora tritici-repentis]|uniref:Ring finger domain containing protein n=1 Tax=Pyrenophora tritici-repentis TaxID=45151 RepID=A0A2W1DL48_9PLEO|nr:zf-RING-2 multi-domain protein [Pyrenophora tritici-repentis]KAF7454427.1 zf-RING-2 multi-domain protein [Pyrenophora tritici-repentis]KAF7577547.1 zf-RING-2 multi-domain protein [Pyrenophora tritici-repentis]KAG9388173.1 zf-RING-2 multi-domain protein [Pyrenophora tritici-repentis]KAI0572518.1 zf-RING-2 multi-domain protein [Pyrenophora tritici-repentis]